ncbi:hypothetical protein [Bacillus sp. AFS031507]|uniref:hypothetical protein n=1 Tax=Bacillus sp. AFS031507 TaxID=2033496 RepID=UPI000BFDADFD|nr:hypothetical protein [Bacillus sp. AFS031507]PGY06713.1 hypothetical protein COE25_26620 [Bacillus sp. AFS031507]
MTKKAMIPTHALYKKLTLDRLVTVYQLPSFLMARIENLENTTNEVIMMAHSFGKTDTDFEPKFNQLVQELKEKLIVEFHRVCESFPPETTKEDWIITRKEQLIEGWNEEQS